MGAVASYALAIGSALFFLGGLAVVALCRMALREGAEFEGEITARSLRLKARPAPGTSNRINPGMGNKYDPISADKQRARSDIE